MRLGSSNTAPVPTVYKDNRITRPQNPYFQIPGGPGGTPDMMFTNGGRMRFTSDQAAMEFTH